MPESAGELTVGTLLQACRVARGRSARRLSLDAGLSESVVGKVESGAIEPSLRVFAAIVAELDLNQREVAALVRLAAQHQASAFNRER
jgi:transcriptional regulator with XRE-family HTH domain